MSSMTADIRQALSRSRFDSYHSSGSRGAGNGSGDHVNLILPASNGGNSGSSSRASSIRGGRGDCGIPDISQLGLGEKRRSVDLDSLGTGTAGSGRSTPVRGSLELDRREDEGPLLDPSRLVVVKRLGEGSGGAVELVKDPGTGRLLAKKVCPSLLDVFEVQANDFFR